MYERSASGSKMSDIPGDKQLLADTPIHVGSSDEQLLTDPPVHTIANDRQLLILANTPSL